MMMMMMKDEEEEGEPKVNRKGRWESFQDNKDNCLKERRGHRLNTVFNS